MRALRLLALLVLLVPAGPAGPAAAGDPAALSQGPEIAIASVVDGDTVRLAAPAMGSDQVRLVGIQAPKLPLGRPGFKKWPLADDSKTALESLIKGRTLHLGFGGAERDRHGRLLAHLIDEHGFWVQGEMLRLGMARVYSFPDNRAVVADMLALEADARAARRGIWSHPFYGVRTPDDLSRLIGTFQLVEGRVRHADKVKARVYLNFGEDWRTDFTVTLDAKARRMFAKAGRDPLAFQGRRVRVRGWLKKLNGPMIEATHPEQIEDLGP